MYPFAYSISDRILTVTGVAGLAGEWMQADGGEKPFILVEWPRLTGKSGYLVDGKRYQLRELRRLAKLP